MDLRVAIDTSKTTLTPLYNELVLEICYLTPFMQENLYKYKHNVLKHQTHPMGLKIFSIYKHEEGSELLIQSRYQWGQDYILRARVVIKYRVPLTGTLTLFQIY